MEKDLWGDITDPGEWFFWVWWIFFPITLPITAIWFLIDRVF